MLLICYGLLFFVGLIAMVRGRITFSNKRVVGDRARLIGFLLILPVPLVFVLDAAVLMPYIEPGLTMDDLTRISNDLALQLAPFEFLIGLVSIGLALYLVYSAPQTSPAAPVDTATSYSTIRPDGTPPEVMTLAEAAHYLRLSEQQVLDLIMSRRLHATQFGKEWRITKYNLDAMLNENENGEV